MTKPLLISSADQWFSHGKSFLAVRQGSYGSFETSWGKSYVLHQESSTSWGKYFATCLSVSLLAFEGSLLRHSEEFVWMSTWLNCTSVASQKQKDCLRTNIDSRIAEWGMLKLKVNAERNFTKAMANEKLGKFWASIAEFVGANSFSSLSIWGRKQGISQHLQHLLNFLSMRMLPVFFKPVQFHTGDIYEGFVLFNQLKLNHLSNQMEILCLTHFFLPQQRVNEAFSLYCDDEETGRSQVVFSKEHMEGM